MDKTKLQREKKYKNSHYGIVIFEELLYYLMYLKLRKIFHVRGMNYE